MSQNNDHKKEAVSKQIEAVSFFYIDFHLYQREFVHFFPLGTFFSKNRHDELPVREKKSKKGLIWPFLPGYGPMPINRFQSQFCRSLLVKIA